MDRELKTKYNLRSPSVKRLMREAMELREPNNQYHAQPLEDNLFEWHFTVRGPPDSDFDNGRYHGRIILPPEYPMKPPSIILLTPNGRFEIGKKICLSMSAHHPEGWQPSWSIRTVLLALIGFMPSKGGGAIGALDYTQQERSILAQRSLNWICDVCQASNAELLPEVAAAANEDAEREAKELATQIDFKGEAKGENSETVNKVNNGITSNPTPVSPPGAHAQQGQMPFTNLYNPYYFQYPLPRPSDTEPNGLGNSHQAPLPRDSEGLGRSQPQPSSNSGQPTERNNQGIEDVKNRNKPVTGQQNAEQRLSAEDIGAQEREDAQVRQRTLPQRDGRAPLVTSGTDRRARRRARDNDGSYFSLVMLWLVTISLVALILRRLCMEALNLNPQG